VNENINGIAAAGAGFIHRFEKGIWYLAIIGFINSVGFSLSLPYVALYLNQERGIPMTLVGVLIMVTGLLSASMQLMSGALCDRFGRRPLLIFSLAGGTLMFALMAALIEITAPVWCIILVYAGLRASIMMANPAIQSMIVDQCPRERLTEANGLIRIGGNLGWAVGPALGGFLLVSLHYSWLFGAATLMRAAALVFALVVIKESFSGCHEHFAIRSIFQAGQDRSFVNFTLLCLMLFLAMGQMSTTLSVYTVERIGFTSAMYGSLLTLNGLMVVVLQYPVTRMLQHVTRKTAMIMGSILYAAGYFCMSFAGPYAMALVAMAIITLGEITIAPTTLAIVGEISPATWRGRYMGFFGLSETLGVSAGPLIGGILLDTFPDGNISIWGPIAGVALVAAAGFVLWNPHKGFTKRVG
jgi:MFS family permease